MQSPSCRRNHLRALRRAPEPAQRTANAKPKMRSQCFRVDDAVAAAEAGGAMKIARRPRLTTATKT